MRVALRHDTSECCRVSLPTPLPLHVPALFFLWTITNDDCYQIQLCHQVAPICVVRLLPRNMKEQQELQQSSDSSPLGGKVFLSMAGLSVLINIVQWVVELKDHA